MTGSRLAFIFFILSSLIGSSGASATEILAIVPRVTIYPGEVVREAMLSEAVVDISEADRVITGRGEAVGKIARRTLFPGRPVGVSMLDDRYTVGNGSLVQLIYERSGISIVASGLALQSAKEGEPIRVRNVDSGLAVTGVVSKSGKVVVGD